MLPDDELDSIGRIIVVIKSYRRQTDQAHWQATDPGRAIYLEVHLSAQDWTFWQQLEKDEQLKLVVAQDEALSLMEFKLLIKRYKGVSYESICDWIQALGKPSIYPK